MSETRAGSFDLEDEADMAAGDLVGMGRRRDPKALLGHDGVLSGRAEIAHVRDAER